MGGLGLHQMKNVNQALLAKLGWKILSSTQSPWVQAIRAKYLKQHSFWDVSPSPTSLWLWKSLLRSRPILKKGVCHLIRNDSNTNIWSDPWLPSPLSFKPNPRNNTIPQSLSQKVDSLIDTVFRQWRLDVLKDLFDIPTILAIIKLHPASSTHNDKLIWISDSKGTFSVK